MNDPFFDEDDGEFDDLYGNPPPAASSPAAQRKPHNSPSPAAQPLTPGSRSLARSPAASSAVSRSYASNATDLAASGKQDKRRRKHGKARRKDSQELFDVQWQSDVAVSRCGLCRADFSLVRRKHHCRHCGRVMCSDCSSFLFFELSHRKHRVCSACNNQLLAEQDAYDREALVNGRDTTSNLFDDSSDEADVTPASSMAGDVKQSNLRSSLVSAFTPKHNGDGEKARKKQEKKEKKERKKREKLEKKGKAVPLQTSRISRRQMEEVEEKPSANGAALFDGADDEWFTDVPGQRTRSGGSADDQSEDGSKGPGWRDRVKDTYTVTPDQPSVLAPIAGSRLTAGITGNGYISEQFRYDDVGGPGLGHDDDSTVEMPRPKQQRATMTHTEHSAKPSQLSGNGYFSDQFKYDDVGGPGLGHEDARSVAMPRPKQQAIDAPYSYDAMQPGGKRSENDKADFNSSFEQEFQPRLTFKDNLKDIFSGTKRQESTETKKEKKARASKPRARGNQSMTMDELNPSYSSEDEPRLPASAMPRPTLTPAQPTFYDDDADNLVVDDSPGFFEATIAEREAQRKKEEEQQQQLAKDMAWVNGSAVPPTVPPHRFSSEQDSYSIVDPPSHTSNSPVEAQRRSRTASDGAGNKSAKGGFTGALKRFFGMGSKATEKPTTPLKPAPVPRASVVPPPVMDDSEKQTLPVTTTSQLDSTSTHEQVTSRLERHTVMDYYAGTQKEEDPAEFTMAGYVDSKEALSRFEASVPPQVSAASQGYDVPQQKPERKRRGTFDDLFDSPKNNVSSDRYSSTGASAWATTGAAATGRASYGASAVGVARFDQRRSFDEGDGVLLGAGSQSDQPAARSLNGPAETWRQSTATSLLDDRVDASQSEGSGFTWSNVRSSPGFGTATYVVPTSLQPRAVYDENRESSFHNDASSSAQTAPLGNIMDDLKRSSTVKKAQGKESVDDFFAEFEEPNDYVFDPATGGYIAARVAPRAVAARPVSRSESTELEAPQVVSEKPASRTSGHDYYASSEPVVRPTARTAVSQDRGAEEVDDEVAEIIVDKISSLESELAALKQLIRTRKGGGTSHVAKQRHSSVRPSARKESIFDNDSSDEESSKPSDPYATSIQPAPKREGRKRSGSKKKHVKKRKDSFADLFEDSPNEAETLGGATSYEALFQTGATRTEAGQEEASDDEEELAPKPGKAKSRKSRRRSSRKINDVVATKADSDSEPEFASLKGRRGKKSSSRRGTSDDADSAEIKLVTTKSEDHLVKPVQVDVIPALKPVKRQEEEDDPIDALFDTSDDHDVAKLYGGDNANAEDAESSAVRPQPAHIIKPRSGLFAQASSTSLTDGEGSGSASIAADNDNSVTSISREPSGLISDSSAQGLDEVDEEEFAINWAKMRKTKSRRRKSRRDPPDSSINPDDSVVAADNTTDLLAPSLLDTGSDVEVAKADALGKFKDTSAPVPSAFLADAASNWMSVSTLEGESVNLSLTGDEDLSSLLESADEREPVASSFEIAPTRGESRDDEDGLTPVTPVVVPTDLTKPIVAAEPSANAKETGSSNDPAEDVVHSEPSMEVLLGVSKAEPLRPSDSTFDIFDKSGDVDFLSMTTPMATTAVDHDTDSAGSENGDRESLPGEDGVFSFEVQAPKKRVSELTVQTSSSVSEQAESSPPSPSSSVDDNVELGKYASTSVPSSTTPSVDGSVDDPEDVSMDDESVLGKVESQAFDADWDQMQAKEKERKKRLQAKQRQAQRDKVLRKQGTSSKALTPHGSSKSKSKSGKKKKKEKEKDDASQSSHHKKSDSSRKHRHREKEDEAPSEPPRSLTEL